jgi:hypothetical protein
MRKIMLFEEHSQESKIGLTIGEDQGLSVPEREKVIDIIKSAGEFYEFGEDEVWESEEKFLEYVDEVYDFFIIPYSEDGKFPIYRAVAADEVDLSTYGIGNSWSVDLGAAKTFGTRLGSDNIKIITATIDPQNIDWEETIANYVNFTSVGDGDSEWEVHVPDGAKIEDIVVTDVKRTTERTL